MYYMCYHRRYKYLIWYLPTGPKVASLYKLLPATSGYVNGYNEDLNPQTLESYSAAAGRGGHSNVVGSLRWEYSSKYAILFTEKWSIILDKQIKTGKLNFWQVRQLLAAISTFIGSP